MGWSILWTSYPTSLCYYHNIYPGVCQRSQSQLELQQKNSPIWFVYTHVVATPAHTHICIASQLLRIQPQVYTHVARACNNIISPQYTVVCTTTNSLATRDTLYSIHQSQVSDSEVLAARTWVTGNTENWHTLGQSLQYTSSAHTCPHSQVYTVCVCVCECVSQGRGVSPAIVFMQPATQQASQRVSSRKGKFKPAIKYIPTTEGYRETNCGQVSRLPHPLSTPKNMQLLYYIHVTCQHLHVHVHAHVGQAEKVKLSES